MPTFDEQALGHSHGCPRCFMTWECPDPECTRPAEATCPGCAAEEWGNVQARACGAALCLARAGWAALRETGRGAEGRGR